MSKPKYYITTAIAYTSGKPHIGNTYEAVLADAIARYKRQQGYDVFFQTGTDEHGQKIELKAEEAGVTPKEFVDNVSGQIKSIWDLMNTSYDKFIRTTDEDHEKQVQKIFKKMYAKGDIYKGEYEGMYCTPCESFFTESQLVDGKCPDCGRPCVPAKEEAYFFKMSKYAPQLIEYINSHPEFIQPVSRKNEMMNNFLLPGLQDLCVSRTSFKWGIPVDFDPKHVVYVWLDALTNYITGIGYDCDGDNSELFNKVQTAITNRKTRSSAKEARNAKPKLLKGLVLCGRCGKVYTNTGRMYTCTSGTNEYSERCGSTSVATASLDSAVWNVTKEIFSEAMAKELAAQKSEPIAAEIARLKEEIEGYNEAISNLKKQVGNLLRIASKADDVADDIIEKINILKKEQQMAKAEIADREAKIALLQKRLDAPAEMTEITDEDEKFEYLHKVIEAVFVYGEHKHKILAIQYLNGITAYCIRLWKDWYWFLDKGELVITDAVALQKNSPVDLKIKDSILIEVTDSNNAYYSGEDTDAEIYGQYTTEAFFAAMMRNKQLKEVKIR